MHGTTAQPPSGWRSHSHHALLLPGMPCALARQTAKNGRKRLRRRGLLRRHIVSKRVLRLWADARTPRARRLARSGCARPIRRPGAAYLDLRARRARSVACGAVGRAVPPRCRVQLSPSRHLGCESTPYCRGSLARGGGARTMTRMMHPPAHTSVAPSPGSDAPELTPRISRRGAGLPPFVPSAREVAPTRPAGTEVGLRVWVYGLGV